MPRIGPDLFKTLKSSEMRNWYTEIIAMDALTGKILTWAGPYIEAPSQELAQQYCETHGLGYVHVTEYWVVEEIEQETGRITRFEHYN